MVAQRKWGDAENAELKRLHAQGLPLNQIHLKMGWSKFTIGKYAKDAGLSFDRSGMEQAIAASQIDRKAIRGEIIDMLYARAKRNIEKMDKAEAEGFMTLVPVGGGEQRTQTLYHVPTGDERNLANAMSSYLGRAEALEKIDQDGGMTEARGMIGSLFATIKASVEGVQRINPTKAVS